MFHSAIEADVDALAEGAGGTIQGELAVLAAGLDTCFLRVGSQLATAVGMIDRVIGGLDRIASALDERTAGAAVVNLQKVAGQLADLPAIQLARADRMISVAQSATMLSSHVLDMRETLMVLNIYGINIKIAASGEVQFVEFVERMKAILGAGEQELNGFMVKLGELTAGVASVQQADRLLGAECASVIPQVPRQLADDAAELAAHLVTVAKLARKVAAIASNVQAKVAVVLSALQVGDSVRQRLEHVVTALQMLDCSSQGAVPEAAVAGHIELLLAAQLDATMKEFSRETTALLQSLAELGPDTRNLEEMIGEQAGGSGRAFLTRLNKGITDVELVTTRLRDAERRSQAMGIVITDTVAELTGRLGSVQRIRRNVQDIATNTRLLCRGHGIMGKAVSVIAKEVDVFTEKLGIATNGVGHAIEHLGNNNVSGGTAGPEEDRIDVGEALAAALNVIQRACQQTDEVVIESGDDARHLMRLLEMTADALHEELGVTQTFEAVALTLSLRTPPVAMTDAADAALRVLLPEIARLYTMAQERDIHARFLLPGMEVAAQANAVEIDDDDDGLF